MYGKGLMNTQTVAYYLHVRKETNVTIELVTLTRELVQNIYSLIVIFEHIY